MTPAAEFRRHAAECRRMARATRDRASKATWTRLADRWLICAELAERASSAARRGRNTAAAIENKRAPMARERPAAPPTAKPEGPARQTKAA